MVERAAVGREAEAVRQLHVAPDDAAAAVQVDQIEVAGDLLVALEHRAAERPRVDAAGGIRRQVVVADVAVLRVAVEQHHGVAAVEGLVGDVPAADDHAVPFVNRHAADAPPMGEDGRNRAGLVEAVDPAAMHVAEYQPSSRNPDRTFDEAVAMCELLHSSLPLWPKLRAFISISAATW